MFLYSAVLTAMMVLSELLLLIILDNVIINFNTAYKNDSFFLLLLTITSKTLYFILIQVSRLILKNDSSIDNKYNLVITLFPVISIIIMITFTYLEINEKLGEHAKTLLLLCTLLLLALNVIIILVYKYISKLYAKYYSIRLERIKSKNNDEYYAMLDKQLENQRVIIHDIKQHLNIISDMAEESNDCRVSEYIFSFQTSLSLQNRVNYSNNTTLNLVLSRYTSICREHNIKISVDIRKETLEFLTPPDIVALFGNLLENAIEATKLTNAPYIDLKVAKNSDSQHVITIENSFIFKPIFLNNGLLQTSKSDKFLHGNGTKSIKKIVKRYTGEISYDLISNSQVKITIVF